MVGAALVLVACRRSLVVSIAARSRALRARLRTRFGRPHRETEGCAGHELACAMERMCALAEWLGMYQVGSSSAPAM